MDKKKLRKIKTAVLGCTGLVGQQFVRMLEKHPFFELIVLSASGKSKGKKYSDAVHWSLASPLPESLGLKEVTEVSKKDLRDSGVEIVFSALPAEVAKDIERSLALMGIYVFSNARVHRMQPDIPILIPEVNAEHLMLVKDRPAAHKGFIVTNSNCSTTGLVLTLKPLMKFGIESVWVSTYQAVSGAGLRGLPAMTISGNVIPFIAGEEQKMEIETAKILGRWEGGGIKPAAFDVNAHCCRVPVRNGHLENVTVVLEQDVDAAHVADSMRTFRGIPQDLVLPTAPEEPLIVRAEQDRPQPFLDKNAGSPERARGMAVTVGRIRKKDKKVNYSLLVHNTVRGAAGTCILNAELAVAQNIIRGLKQDKHGTGRQL